MEIAYLLIIVVFLRSLEENCLVLVIRVRTSYDRMHFIELYISAMVDSLFGWERAISLTARRECEYGDIIFEQVLGGILMLGEQR